MSLRELPLRSDGFNLFKRKYKMPIVNSTWRASIELSELNGVNGFTLARGGGIGGKGAIGIIP